MARRIFHLGAGALRGPKRWSARLLDRASRIVRRVAGTLRAFREDRRARAERRAHERVERQRKRVARPSVPEHADERTIRRIAEQQAGGMSSEEAVRRWRCGDNPGGLHHRAMHRDEGPLHPRPEYEEPQDRVERVPRGEKHIPAHRRGS